MHQLDTPIKEFHKKWQSPIKQNFYQFLSDVYNIKTELKNWNSNLIIFYKRKWLPFLIKKISPDEIKLIPAAPLANKKAVALLTIIESELPFPIKKVTKFTINIDQITKIILKSQNQGDQK